MDRESLKRDHETYNNLKNNIVSLKKLDDEKIALEGRIKEYKWDLKQAYGELPYLYKQEIPLADSDLAKKLQSIYQEEDKEKNKYETSIGELEKQIIRKPQFIREIDGLETKTGNRKSD